MNHHLWCCYRRGSRSPARSRRHRYHNRCYSPWTNNTRWSRYRPYSSCSRCPNGFQSGIFRNHKPTCRRTVLTPSRPRSCFHCSYGSANSHCHFSHLHGGISAPLQCYTSGRLRSKFYRRQSRRTGLRFRCRRCGGSSLRSARRLRRTHPNQSAHIYPGRSLSNFANRRTSRSNFCILHQTI